MGYMKIPNLYKDKTLLLFKQVYALEKIHGTSAHVSFTKTETGVDIKFFPGGGELESFKKLFDLQRLAWVWLENYSEKNSVIIYGELFGGKLQAMSHIYGKALQFFSFDVEIGGSFVDVPNMSKISTHFGIRHVPWKLIDATIENIEAAKLEPSEVAKMLNVGLDKEREGVVLRPLIEMHTNSFRVIAKHRILEFQERKSGEPKLDAEKLQVMTEAKAIAEEWVVPMRLTHILDKLQFTEHSFKNIPLVGQAIVNDVQLEAKDEVVWSPAVERAIRSKAIELYKQKIGLKVEL